ASSRARTSSESSASGAMHPGHDTNGSSDVARDREGDGDRSSSLAPAAHAIGVASAGAAVVPPPISSTRLARSYAEGWRCRPKLDWNQLRTGSGTVVIWSRTARVASPVCPRRSGGGTAAYP